jgi:glycosyltransferase involved in cell wall biosynthesis
MKGIIKSIIMTGIEKLQEFLLRFVDVPIAISSFAMDFFRPGRIRSRALLSSNGVPTIYLPKESIHHRKFDIVYVGRVIERKNLRTVLEALSLFQQDINFLLITNSSKDHVSSLINENLTNDHVSVTVKYKVNEEDKYLLLNDSKISINLSYDENFSISTLETAACGNALVLSNRDFFRQIYGDAAVYADPFDAAAVFTCIESLLIDQGKLDRMSDMALSIAERFQYRNIAMTEYSEIRKAVEKNS